MNGAVSAAIAAYMRVGGRQLARRTWKPNLSTISCTASSASYKPARSTPISMRLARANKIIYSAVVVIAAAVTWGMQDVPPPETEHHPSLFGCPSPTGFLYATTTTTLTISTSFPQKKNTPRGSCLRNPSVRKPKFYNTVSSQYKYKRSLRPQVSLQLFETRFSYLFSSYSMSKKIILRLNFFPKTSYLMLFSMCMHVQELFSTKYS